MKFLSIFSIFLVIRFAFSFENSEFDAALDNEFVGAAVKLNSLVEKLKQLPRISDVLGVPFNGYLNWYKQFRRNVPVFAKCWNCQEKQRQFIDVVENVRSSSGKIIFTLEENYTNLLVDAKSNFSSELSNMLHNEHQIAPGDDEFNQCLPDSLTKFKPMLTVICSDFENCVDVELGKIHSISTKISGQLEVIINYLNRTFGDLKGCEKLKDPKNCFLSLVSVAKLEGVISPLSSTLSNASAKNFETCIVEQKKLSLKVVLKLNQVLVDCVIAKAPKDFKRVTIPPVDFDW